MVPNTDLFYLSGIEQEESILVLFPSAEDERMREMLFLRETSELIAIWEGHKLTKPQAMEVSGIRSVHWMADFPRILHRLMCESQSVWLNTNEHKRAVWRLSRGMCVLSVICVPDIRCTISVEWHRCSTRSGW